MPNPDSPSTTPRWPTRPASNRCPPSPTRTRCACSSRPASAGPDSSTTSDRGATPTSGIGSSSKHRLAEPPLDVLVLGSGVAGLTAAIRAATDGLRVGVLTKGKLSQSATRWAQGGVAAVLSPEEDSADLHLADTL